MNIMRKTAFSSLVLCGLLSGACVIAVEDPAAQGKHWPYGSFRKSLSLKPGGSVSLENSDGDVMISGTEGDKVEIYAQHGQKAPPSAGIHFIGSWFSPPDVHIRTTPDSVRIRTGENGYGDQGDAVHY